MTFTWKKGFGELEEKVNSQNKNGHRKMNQKDLSVFVNFPKKIRIMILDQNFYNFYLKKSCRSSLSELIFKKYISEILEYTLFKYKQYFYKQRQAVKQKAKQHHQPGLLTKMYK